MNVTSYLGLCAVEKAESLAVRSNTQLIEFARGFYGGLSYKQAYDDAPRSLLAMAGVVEALADELEAALKKIDRLETCPDQHNPDCACQACEIDAVDIAAVQQRRGAGVKA